jgi:outer membrane lipoprotein-sorting protein
MAGEETGDVEIVRKCLAANVPQQTSEQAVTFTAVDRTGFVTESTARLYWRRFDNGSRSTLCFSSPPDLRGSAVLLIAKEDRADIFMYLPELRKVRRINKRSVSGSVLGTDFSYEDLERLQGMSQERDLKRLEDAEIEGRAVYVVEGRPARGEESEYDRIVSHVDKETCVPLRMELFEGEDRTLKVLQTSHERVERSEAGFFPMWLRMDDAKAGTHTELVVHEIRTEHEIPEKTFTQRALEQCH